MPKRKAVSKLSGLIDSDGEDDIQMSGAEAPAAEVEEEGPPAKKAKGRPKAAAAAATTKPAKRKPRKTVTAPITRRKKPPAKQAAEEPRNEDEDEQGNEHDPVNVTTVPETQRKPEEEEEDDVSADELESPKIVPARRGPSPAKPPAKRTRARAAKKVTVDDGFEYTPTGTRQIKPDEIQKEEGVAKRTGTRGRKATAKPKEVNEAPPEAPPEEEEASEVDETTFPDEGLQHEQEPAPSPSKSRVNGNVGVKGQTNRKPKAGTTSDNETAGNEPTLRRKLGEMTKKFENLDSKYRNLREVGVVEANANFEKLRKQCEVTTAASDELIASLKKELAAQSALAQKSRNIQKQLNERDAEITKLRSNVDDGTSGLAAAQNEIKALQAKLAASRETTASSKNQSSAAKAGTNARNGVVNSAETAHAAQIAQLKEDLYSDLTGLIIRDVKKRESDHLYDCIQTGMNGTLHFKLAIAEEDSGVNFEDVEFHYMPLLDPNRDKDLIAVLPDYLTVDITFSRRQSAKFYSRITDTLTKRRAED